MATREPATESGPKLCKNDEGRPTSVEEFAQAEFEEPWTYERVDGRLVVMSPEGSGLVILHLPWIQRLNVYSFDHPETVQGVVTQAWIIINARNTRIAEIGVDPGGRLEDLDIPNQIPELVFEFVSPSAKDRRRDHVEKRPDSQKQRVCEYMIVDRSDKTLTVLTLEQAGYVEALLSSSGTYRSPLPGFEMIPAEVLPR